MSATLANASALKRSVNNSVFVQKIDGIKRKGRALKVSDTRATDSDPVYSPDGRYLAYLGGARPGYEADRRRVKLYDRRTKRTRVLTEDLDRSAGSLEFTPDGKHLLFLAQDRAHVSVYRVPVKGGSAAQLTGGTTNSQVVAIPLMLGAIIVLVIMGRRTRTAQEAG